jgi:hypothetical protein
MHVIALLCCVLRLCCYSVEYKATVDGSEIRTLAKNVNIAMFIPRLAVSTALL